MNNVINITVRVFPVTIMDERTREVSAESIVLTRQQLQAAQLIGESSKELIHRLYNRQGYRVADIGKPIKRTISIDLYHTGDEIVAEGDARTDEKVVEMD